MPSWPLDAPAAPATILAVASDPGGARAILPVLHTLAQAGWRVVVAESPTLGSEAPPDWPRLAPEWLTTPGRFAPWVQENRVKGVLLGTGLQDPTPLLALQQANTLGLPSLMILDNWTGYRSRMQLDGEAVWPRIYGVMDELAQQEAIHAGVPATIIRVLGHPGLAPLAAEADRWRAEDRQALRRQVGCPPSARLLLFVSEPVTLDQGSDPARPEYRGYTEQTVLTALANSLQSHRERLWLALAPHPREDPHALAGLWERVRGGLPGRVLADVRTRSAVLAADGVVGMASLVLYESWLLTRPTLSLQPGVCRRDLTSLAQRAGLWFVDQATDSEPGVARWLAEIFQDRPALVRPELQRHGQAAAQAADWLRCLAEEPTGG